MTYAQRVVRFAAVLGLFVTGFMFAGPAAAQEEEGFPLGAIAAYCEPGYAGPFVGCTPWEGVTVSYESTDGSFSGSCITSDGERAAGCAMSVPFGSTIIASIDPSVVSDGYYLQGEAAQTFDIPDESPTGLFGGPVFVLLPLDDSGDEPVMNESEVGESPDPAGSAASSLPSTGTGLTGDMTESRLPLAPVMFMGAASLLMLGAFGLRRSSR